MKVEKGSYGYRKVYKKRQGAMIFIFLVAILAQVIASKLVASQNFSRILIVMSILTVLPMANLASPFLATFRYQTPSQEEMKKILAFSDRGELLFDLVVTMREQIMPLDYVMIVPGYALCYICLLYTSPSPRD